MLVRRARLDDLAEEVDLGQQPIIVGVLLPESLQLPMKLAAEVERPEIFQYVLGCHGDFVVFVIGHLAGAIAVEPGEIAEQVAVVLVLGIETMHHQLGQGK
ncbi:hypothetical protein D3C81_1183030 [compost metagenome]